MRHLKDHVIDAINPTPEVGPLLLRERKRRLKRIHKRRTSIIQRRKTLANLRMIHDATSSNLAHGNVSTHDHNDRPTPGLIPANSNIENRCNSASSMHVKYVCTSVGSSSRSNAAKCNAIRTRAS